MGQVAQVAGLVGLAEPVAMAAAFHVVLSFQTAPPSKAGVNLSRSALVSVEIFTVASPYYVVVA